MKPRRWTFRFNWWAARDLFNLPTRIATSVLLELVSRRTGDCLWRLRRPWRRCLCCSSAGRAGAQAYRRGVPVRRRRVSKVDAGGQSLVLADQCTPGGPPGIVRFSLATGEKQCLHAPPASDVGDVQPALSPDEKTVAFLKMPNADVTELYTVSLSGGQLRQFYADANSYPCRSGETATQPLVSELGHWQRRFLWV
jgi:hypothetical protein